MLRRSQNAVWMQLTFGEAGANLKARVRVLNLFDEIRERLCGDDKGTEKREFVTSAGTDHRDIDSRKSGTSIDSSYRDRGTTLFAAENTVGTAATLASQRTHEAPSKMTASTSKKRTRSLSTEGSHDVSQSRSRSLRGRTKLVG